MSTSAVTGTGAPFGRDESSTSTAPSRSAAARLAPDEVAVPVEVGLFGRCDSCCLEFRAQAELGELADRVRQQVDADAERLELG
jgi:hypothetical protein